MARAKTKQQLTAENEELRARIREMEETLEAIRSGAVDAIVTSGPTGERVYTLEGADHAYRMMVESMNEGAVTLMMDGTILYANRQLGQMTGTDSSEMVGRRMHDFVFAADHPIIDEIIQRAGSAGVKPEVRLVREAAAEIPARLSASPIDLSGMQALTLVVTDLSDQKRLEDIVAAEKLARRILDQAQEGIAVCIDGYIVRANHALYEICGCMPLMQPFDQIFSLSSPESEPFSVDIPQAGKMIRNREVRYQRPDGRRFDLILSASPLRGSQGEIHGCLISLVDVTGLKQAERRIAALNLEMRQKIQNLEAVFNTAPIGLAITEDPEGRHIRGNPANEIMLGVPRGGELSQHPDADSSRYRVLQDGREMAVEELPVQRAVRGETVSNLIMDVVREDGSTIKLYGNASPLLDERGRPRGAVGAFLDITELARTQESLRESEERYRVLLDTAPDAIVVHRDGRFLFANEAALRLYGAADLEQLRSRNIVDLIHPDERDLIRARIRRVQSGERTNLLEARLLRFDGGEVSVEALAAPVDYEGKRAVQVILRDITERKLARQALQESEVRYRSLFGSMSEGFALHEIITDDAGTPVDYRFLDINSSFERLTGLKRQDVVGRLKTESMSNDDPEWIALYGKVALTGEPLQLEKYSPALGRWYQVFSYRPAPRQFAVIFMDVTERRRLEEESRSLLAAVQKEKDRLAALISSMNDEVWLADTDRNFRLVNPRAMREFGFEDAGNVDIEKLAASLEVYRPDGTPRPVEEAPPLRALNGEVVRNEEEIIRTLADGRLRYREVNSSPVRDAAGDIIGSVSVVRDITDRKNAENLLKADLDTLIRMHALSGRVLGAGGFQPLLQEVMDVAVLIMGAQRGTLQLLEGDTLRIVAHHGHEPPFLGYFASAERRASACGEALLRGERVIIPDIEKSPVFTGTPSLPVLRAASVRAVQSTPMVNRTGETVGIITTQWDAPNQPGEHDLWRIDLLARQATDLTEQVQAQEALQKSEARFRLLSETAARLLAAEDPQGLIDSLCRQVMEHLDCQAFFNFMVDEREGRLRLNACAGIPGEEVRKLEWLDYGVAVCGCVARDEARIIAEDIFHTPDARTELVKSYGIQAYCCHPLKDQGRLIGTLSFGTKTRAHFTPDEVELMRTVADQVAVALQRIESKRELLETGQRLSLTLDAGGMGAWALDPRSNRVIWNPKMYELLGLPADGGVENPETFFALVHPEDQQGMRGAVADVLARTGLFRQEFRVVRPDGKVLWMASVGRVMTDEAGQPGSFAGVSYDITSRKEREKELGMLNRMLRALSHSSHAQALAEDEKAYLEDVCRIVVRDCGYAMVWIGYAENDEGKTVRPMAHAGFEGGYLETLNLTWADRERGRGPTGTAIREARPVLCADMLTEPRFAPWRDEALNRGYASSLALPLLSEGDAFGAVTVYSREPNPFTKDEVSLLSELAEDLMRGITTLRLREANREARKALQRSKDELEEKVRERTAELTCLLAELEQGRDDLRKLASELVMAEEMERKRIAVTLHDEVAQTLAAAKMRLDMLKNERDPAESQRFFGEARELLGQSIREARALMSDISSPVLYEMGLPSALQALAEQTSAGRGISISYSCSGDPGDLQTEIAVMIYQVVRELLQNIIKHSGARMASIRLTREDHSVRTVVADDGKGFNAADIGSPGRESGFGIFSIRERLKSFGGNVQIESAPGKGTVVTVTLPAKITDGDAAARERRVSAKRGKRGKP